MGEPGRAPVISKGPWRRGGEAGEKEVIWGAGFEGGGARPAGKRKERPGGKDSCAGGALRGEASDGRPSAPVPGESPAGKGPGMVNATFRAGRDCGSPAGRSGRGGPVRAGGIVRAIATEPATGETRGRTSGRLILGLGVLTRKSDWGGAGAAGPAGFEARPEIDGKCGEISPAEPRPPPTAKFSRRSPADRWGRGGSGRTLAERRGRAEREAGGGGFADVRPGAERARGGAVGSGAPASDRGRTADLRPRDR